MPTITPAPTVPTTPLSPKVINTHPRQTDTVKDPVTALATDDLVVETPPEVKEEPLSPRLIALARKETELRRQQQALQAEKAALESKGQTFEKDYVSKASIMEDPVAALAAMGISYDQLTQHVLNPKDETTKKLEAEVKALRERQDQSTQRQEEQQKQQYEHAVNQIRNEVKVLVDSDAEFETIKSMDAVEDVVDHIKKHFEETNTVLTVKEASKAIEDKLFEKAVRMAGLNKVKSKLTPAEQLLGATEKKSEQPTSETPKLKTLTNAQQGTSKPRTSKERIERAILRAQGKLT